MGCLTHNRVVRVFGRTDDHANVSAHYTPSATDPRLQFDALSAKTNMPSSPLLEDHDGVNCNASVHARRLATVRQTINSTVAHITRSAVLIADLHTSISKTKQIIRTSQQLIRTSDLAIARARSGESADDGTSLVRSR